MGNVIVITLHGSALKICECWMVAGGLGLAEPVCCVVSLSDGWGLSVCPILMMMHQSKVASEISLKWHNVTKQHVQISDSFK
jgi:hypothetical protein